MSHNPENFYTMFHYWYLILLFFKCCMFFCFGLFLFFGYFCELFVTARWTKLRFQLKSLFIFWPGFTLIRNERIEGDYDGIAIYLRHYISHKMVSILPQSSSTNAVHIKTHRSWAALFKVTNRGLLLSLFTYQLFVPTRISYNPSYHF